MAAEKKTYIVTYQKDEFCTFCTNLAIAENEDDVKANYEEEFGDIKCLTIKEAKSHEIEPLKRRGCPVVECKHVEQLDNLSAYDDAIFYASYDFCMWRQQHERVQHRYEQGDGDTNFVRLMENDERMYAAATQAQQQLIGYLFDMPEEKVYTDLMREYEEQRVAGVWK